MSNVVPFKPKPKRMTRMEMEYKFFCDMTERERRFREIEIKANDDLLRLGLWWAGITITGTLLFSAYVLINLP